MRWQSTRGPLRRDPQVLVRSYFRMTWFPPSSLLVFPQPAPPQTIVVRPLGRPPLLISSKPGMPVGVFFRGRTFPAGRFARVDIFFRNPQNMLRAGSSKRGHANRYKLSMQEAGWNKVEPNSELLWLHGIYGPAEPIS